MPPIIPNYHPIMVNFTIALIVTSLGMFLLAYLVKSNTKLHQECVNVSRWCLWVGALATILTVITGFHAYYTVVHDTISHTVMATHRNWGILAFILIELTAIWSIVLYLKQKNLRWLYIIGLLLSATLVTITAWYGAELVFRYGIGVLSLPQHETAGHQQVSPNKPTLHHDHHAH